MSDVDLTAGAYSLAFLLAGLLVACGIGWLACLDRNNVLVDENRRLTVENDRLAAHECDVPDETVAAHRCDDDETVAALRARLETYRHNAGRHIEGTFTDTTRTGAPLMSTEGWPGPMVPSPTPSRAATAVKAAARRLINTLVTSKDGYR